MINQLHTNILYTDSFKKKKTHRDRFHRRNRCRFFGRVWTCHRWSDPCWLRSAEESEHERWGKCFFFLKKIGNWISWSDKSNWTNRKRLYLFVCNIVWYYYYYYIVSVREEFEATQRRTRQQADRLETLLLLF